MDLSKHCKPSSWGPTSVQAGWASTLILNLPKQLGAYKSSLSKHCKPPSLVLPRRVGFTGRGRGAGLIDTTSHLMAKNKCRARGLGRPSKKLQGQADVAVKVHTGALTLFLCSRRSFPAVHEGTPPASMLSGTHGAPGPADNPHGGPADRLNRSGSTPSRPVSAVVQGQDERITRDPAYRTCSTPCWPCWYTHVRLEVRAGYEGKAWAGMLAAGAVTALSCPWAQVL